MLPAIGNTRLPSDLKLQLLPLAMTFTLPVPLPMMLTAPTMLPAVGKVKLPSVLNVQVLPDEVMLTLPLVVAMLMLEVPLDKGKPAEMPCTPWGTSCTLSRLHALDTLCALSSSS